MLFCQIGLLQFHIEHEGRFRWWWTWRELIVEHDPRSQDYWNYQWHLSVGWLWWSAEITWQKSWHTPYFQFDWSKL